MVNNHSSFNRQTHQSQATVQKSPNPKFNNDDSKITKKPIVEITRDVTAQSEEKPRKVDNSWCKKARPFRNKNLIIA